MHGSSRCRALTRLGLLGTVLIASLETFAAPAPTPATPVLGYDVVARYPHSTSSYTEGFFYRDGLFYEGTGIVGHSKLLVTEPENGHVLQQRELPSPHFGEGIVDWGAEVYQWTWQHHIGFVYDRFSLRPLRRFTYSGEGWGMTHDAAHIITSDGTDTLRFRDPKSFRVVRSITVHDGAEHIDQLNELEFVHGVIYANIWHADRVAEISPRDGHVIAWLDLSGLLPDDERPNSEAVLNGIAFDAKKDRLFVTGKQWPYVFEIRVHPSGVSSGRK